MTIAASSLLLVSPSQYEVDESKVCEVTIWDNVHRPWRLMPIQCVNYAEGKIVYRHNNEDGDAWMLVLLDPEYEYLIEGREKQQPIYHGKPALVVEAICQVPTEEEACQGYKRELKIPRVGSHVFLGGTLVEDTQHSLWREIHPVGYIQKTSPTGPRI